ncbi:PF20097 family protein [Propioniciclava soli]|uniref:PF20097 family protein n=1 Tax=Propioniciclava soli TaxID=2775081 RepID=A0ABZ3C675_9ACTN|nr:PF20097 family protein [Propioniciclava soli]
MNCPRCGKVMEEGLVQSTGHLAWVREPRRLLASLAEGDVRVARSIFGAATLPGYLCRACELVTIAYGEDDPT